LLFEEIGRAKGEKEVEVIALNEYHLDATSLETEEGFQCVLPVYIDI
jgi:hypothetical protein